MSRAARRDEFRSESVPERERQDFLYNTTVPDRSSKAKSEKTAASTVVEVHILRVPMSIVLLKHANPWLCNTT